MSLLLALDPGASPSRPGCEARGCRSTSTTSVRAHLGRIHPTTLRVCETHRRALEVAGDLENPVNCLIPECGRTRAAPSRLCAVHEPVVTAAQITIPRKGVVGADTLLAVRRAVETEEKRQAAIAAAPPVRPQMDEPAPDYMGACWRHLADLVPGGTRIDKAVEQVVADLKRTRSVQRETEERRHRAETLLGDVQYLLTELGAPAGRLLDDGTLDASITSRIRLLAAQPAPAVQAVPPAGWPPSWDDLSPNLGVWRRLQAGHSLYLPATEEGRLAAWVLTGWRPGADGAALAEAERVAGLNPGITWVAEALEGIAGPGVYPHRDYMPSRILQLLDDVSDDRSRMAALRREREQFTAHLAAMREALNVGPPSDSDVREDCPADEVSRIVRERTRLMLEERAQRVALAERVQELETAQGDPLALAVKTLVAWLDLPTGAALVEQMIRAVAERTVEPEDAILALRDREKMARIVLSTPEPFGASF